ncbi:hypothetical protein GBA52_013284, partial [Prunus armeniaca]
MLAQKSLLEAIPEMKINQEKLWRTAAILIYTRPSPSAISTLSRYFKDLKTGSGFPEVSQETATLIKESSKAQTCALPSHD